MKKTIILLSVLISTIIANNDIQAQHVSVNINIGTQPAWGPVGYDYVDYYYLPDINVYYMVNSNMFVYLDGRKWITARYLPNRYRHYDLYNMYKVVLVGGPRDPWIHNGRHYKEYNRYRNYKGQKVIRDSRDNRYYRSRNNHASWYRDDNRYNNHNSYQARPNNRIENNKNSNNRNNSRNKVVSTSRNSNSSSVNSRSNRSSSSSRSSNYTTISNTNKKDKTSTRSSSRTNDNRRK